MKKGIGPRSVGIGYHITDMGKKGITEYSSIILCKVIIIQVKEASLYKELITECDNKLIDLSYNNRLTNL